MHFLGIDCHKEMHTWALYDETGRLVSEGSVRNALPDLRALRAQLPAPLSVGLEGSRDLRHAIERAFVDCPLFEICAAWTNEWRHRGRPRPKNDRYDARRVALCLLESHAHLVEIPKREQARATLGVLLQAHRRVVKDRVRCALRIHARLTCLWLCHYAELFNNPLAPTARWFFAQYPHPHLAAHARSLGERLRKRSRGHFGRDLAERIKSVARQFEPPTPAQLVLADELCAFIEQLDLLEREAARIVVGIQQLLHDLDAGWLLSEPGLGPVQVGTLIDAGLLESPGANGFARLAGIAPEDDSSGKRERRVNPLRRNEVLFTTLMNWAQWQVVNVEPASAYYQRKRAEGKTHCTAIRCEARRLIDRLLKLRQQHRDAVVATPADDVA
jgi:transposase